jgi:dihydroorotate dehydrogenase electron transfer subunit
MSARKFIHDFTVLNNRQINPRHFVLDLSAPVQLPEMLPGQFVELWVEDSHKAFLRRPFSIHSVNPAANTFQLLIQIKGEATKKLGDLKTGGKVNIIYPLGNSFSMPNTLNVLLVGGGCGVAPLLFLAIQLNTNGIRPLILVGGKSKKDLLEVDEYRKYGEVLITTEDGSEGEKGLATGHSIFSREQPGFNMIYCCGPDPMMKKVAEIAGKYNVDCEVSLENSMACGFGVCLCCVTPTVNGNQRVCMEGPVFNTKQLGWTNG